MDTEDMRVGEECEHLVNVVVESRKRFGKICNDYEQKSTLIENKMLEMQLENINNQRYKSKTALPDIDVNKMVDESKQFLAEVLERRKTLDSLSCDVKSINNVLLKLKACRATKKCAKPLTVEDILADAHNKP